MNYNLIITAGDPSGIGVEILLKFFNQKKIIKNDLKISYILIGTKEVFLIYAKIFNIRILFTQYENSELNFNGEKLLIKFIDSKNTLQFINVSSKFNKKVIGKINIKSGILSYKYLKIAIDLIKNSLNFSGTYFGLVTAPISKKSISLTQPEFIDHTNFLINKFKIKKYSMVFLSKIFNLLLLTTHIPINKISKIITSSNIQNILTNAFEIQDIIGDTKPILFLGLNPHAGENGCIGSEELLISTEIKKFIQKNPKANIVGPVSPDSAFISIINKTHQTIIACYHDQGLIAFKTLTKIYQKNGVQLTWGLPFIRTSVDHGTAFDISGKNIADIKPFEEAIIKNIEMFNLNKKIIKKKLF